MQFLRNPLNSIRGKLILSFVLIVVVPTLIIFLWYTYHSRSVIEEEVYDKNQEIVERSAAGMNDLASRMVKASVFVQSDFNQFYSSNISNWRNDYNAYAMVKQLQLRLTTTRDLLLDSDAFIQVVDFHNFALSTLQSFDTQHAYDILTKEPWYAHAIQSNGYPYWSFPYRLKESIGYTNQGMTDSFVLMSRYLREDDGGMLVSVVGVPSETFFGKPQVGTDGVPRFLIQASDGQVTDPLGKSYSFTTDKAPTNFLKASISTNVMIDGHRYLVNTATVPQMGISLLYLMPYDQFLKQLDQTTFRSFIGILITFMLGILLFVLLLIRMTKPIYSLLYSMQQVGKGDFDASVSLKGKDEIALLGFNFNKMVIRLKELIYNLEEEQRNKEEARFQALQAQINPHFLFNTLNSIKLMAMISNTNRDVSDMITALGKLFEFSMKQSQQYVTLRQELEYLELYMSLQKIRYHDNIQLYIDVPEQLMEMYVLKFSLQPLVENSLIHGGKMPLSVWVEAKYTADEAGMVVSVIDNGHGVAENELARIQEKMTNDSTAKYSGIGISNVDKRLKLHFGEQYGITLQTSIYGGLQTDIWLPLREEESA